ncbi:MAG: membrane protein [Deinococcales bacterium]|jgi:uncharacterized membrane protein YczE
MTGRALRAVSTRAFWQRLGQLNLGLMVLGLGIAFMLEAGIGLGPWTVFHQGLSLVTGLSFGRVMQGVGLVVLLLSMLLTRTRPGLGTALNMLLVGPWVDLFRSLAGFPHAPSYALGIAEFVLGLTLQGLGTGLYITARFGAGPRDGLVLGLASLLRLSVRITRTGLELLVLVSGWLMGGQVGLGTVLFALGIGPLMQSFLRLFGRPSEPSR